MMSTAHYISNSFDTKTFVLEMKQLICCFSLFFLKVNCLITISKEQKKFEASLKRSCLLFLLFSINSKETVFGHLCKRIGRSTSRFFEIVKKDRL